MNLESCLGADLRIGSLIFGYLHLMKDLTQIVISMNILIVKATYRPVFFYYHRYETTFSAIFLTLGAMSLIFAFLFLKGLNQYKPELIKTFLIYNEISTVIYLLLGVLLICIHRIFIALVPLLLFLALYIYFLLVIRSYYLKMDKSETKAALISTSAGVIVV